MTLDQYCLDRQLNRELIGDLRTQYPLCRKGIELLPRDANPKTIEQAVEQLRHAVVAKALDSLVHQVDDLLGAPTPLFVIVPIIVTTAELWRLARIIHEEADYSRKTNAPVWYKGCAHRPFATTEALT